MGGNAQIKAYRQVAGRLRLDLAQYRELEAFAQFGSELDEATQRTLARGARMVEVLNQPRFQPLPVEEQVAQIFAGAEGYLDDVPVERVREYLAGLRGYLRAHHADVLEQLAAAKEITAEIDKGLRTGVEEFQRGFAAEAGSGELPPPRESAAAAGEAEPGAGEPEVDEETAES